MKSSFQFSFRRASAAFTLIEMIGVLAIMAIMAAILVPNALKAIDGAATKAEVETLRNLGTAVEGYFRKYRVTPTEENPAIPAPGVPAWATELGNFSSLSAADIAFNRRAQRRVYLLDPAAPRQRVIILSAMDNQIVAPNVNALPRQANVNTAAQFQTIWATVDGTVPPSSNWNGWIPWNARAEGGSLLVIQRVNLTPIYNNELQPFTIVLNNATPTTGTPSVPATTACYRKVLLSGGAQAYTNLYGSGIPPGPSTTNFTLLTGDRIDFYRVDAATAVATSASPVSSFVVSNSGRTFYFNGTTWIPQ